MDRPEDEMQQGPALGKEKGPFWLTLLSFVAFAFLLVVMVYLGERLENIEEQLSYQLPAMTDTQPASGQ